MRSDAIETEVRALRDAVRDLERPSWTTPIPPALRARIVACAGRAAAAGWSGATVARTIGVSLASLYNWQRTPPPVALVPVQLTEPPAERAPTALSVVAPSGYRVDGLDVPTAAALLRALG